jgi:diaminohydroxyphosphoribosylaminopyrimidine deaminase / 5-amino-6-(5-phosphoribosylamino)uracil reductase
MLPDDFTEIDLIHMREALRLAALAPYSTRPNPRVGCVIAKGAQVIGRGYHQRAGEAHAEVFALREAGSAASGASAYVSLEPCAHFGRTPPCADALIRAGIARVVVAGGDPFSEVDGLGIARLKAAGITVEVGLLRAEARALNLGFYSRIERQRPWVRVKLACSLDGKTALANGQSQWITSAEARLNGHRLRASACAILSGIGTVLTDNPRLDVRLPEGESAHQIPPPLRVIADRHLRMPLDAAIWSTPGRIAIAHGADVSDSKRQQLFAQGAQCWHIESNDDSEFLHQLMQELHAQQINELHVEAGARLSGALVQAGLMDQMVLYQAPVILGSSARGLIDLPEIAQMADKVSLHLQAHKQLGPDLRLDYWSDSGLDFSEREQKR